MSSIHNGGITVTIGGKSINTVSSYSVSTHRGENTAYTDISITTGVLPLKDTSTGTAHTTDASDLLALGQYATATVVCPDFNGTMYLTNVSSDLASANIFGKYCRVTLSLTTEPPDSATKITVGGITVDLSSYECSYSYERESFEMYDYSTYNIEKGRRCHISYTTKPLTNTQANGLIAAFRGSPVQTVSADYSGYMSVDSCSKSAQVVDGETKYTFSVSCTAVAMDTGAST